MKRVALPILLFFFVYGLTAQSVSLLERIRQDSAIDLTLSMDWKSFVKNKKEKAYQPCQVNLVSNSEDSLHLSGKARTRGHMRLDICSFPPLKLKFDKNDIEHLGLSPFNEMDVVHHCHEADAYNQYLLREYLAYRIWQHLSPYAFQTQLLKLHYLNEDGSEAHETSFAFLVENTDELVARLSGRRNKTAVISNTAVDREPMLKVALFQFMIGNTDWFIQNRHNLEFVAIPGHRFLVTIPYDFDYSGLVSAPYAAAHESLKLPSVDIRYYQGWCFTEEEVNNALKVFLEQKENILALPALIEGLNEKSIKYVTEYLQGFYEIIESPKKLENQIIRHCDMWPPEN